MKGERIRIQKSFTQVDTDGKPLWYGSSLHKSPNPTVEHEYCPATTPTVEHEYWPATTIDLD
eukprot:CAMPEP_0185763808 /NCGR_PEP_ID=MMETSP1174-20130828/22706_1 /TAXON_ID=35687 /ORGANISM="Dictyocha speculum, Strain CCMP1381" /LENGTH=61 /DNA_ID=CAMNT_0028446049 /DNA_START=273 /DNA_END=458 /DNA_ORIENTATION=+